MTDKGLFWVTRARKGMRYEATKTRPVAEGGPVPSDQTIRLNSKQARQAGTYDIRRVGYLDPGSGKTYVSHHQPENLVGTNSSRHLQIALGSGIVFQMD